MSVSSELMVKEGGIWKGTSDRYEKVNGVWKHATDEYMKVGGVWVDMFHLSDTKLDYDMAQATTPAGTRYLINKVEPAAYKANMHSGFGVALGTTHTRSMRIPIDVNYGTVSKYRGTEVAGGLKLTSIAGGKHITGDSTVTAGRITIKSLLNDDLGVGCKVTFTAKINSGIAMCSTIIAAHSMNGVITEHSTAIVSGSNTIIIGIDEIIHYVHLNMWGKTAFDIELTDIKMLPVTKVVTKSVVYYSMADKKYKAITKDGGTDNLVTNGNFSTSDLSSFSNYASGVIALNKGKLDVTTGTKHGGVITRRLDYSVLGSAYKVDLDITGIAGHKFSVFADCADHNEYVTADGPVSFTYTTTRGTANNLAIRDLSGDNYMFTVDNISVYRTFVLSSSYKIIESFNNAVRLDTKVVTDADLAYLNAHPDALAEMWFGKAHPALSFSKVDMSAYYPGLLLGYAPKGLVPSYCIADYTKPQGKELVTNGEFTTDLKGWTGAIASSAIEATPEYPNGSLRIPKTGTTVNRARSISQPITLVVGKTYIISTDTVKDKAVGFGITITAATTGAKEVSYYVGGVVDPGRHISTFAFVATTSSATLQITSVNNVRGANLAYVSIKQEDVLLVPSVNIAIANQFVNVNFGMQLFNFIATKGRLTGVTKDGEISGSTDGRWVDLPLVDTTKKHHSVTKCLKEIKGDITQIVDVKCIP